MWCRLSLLLFCCAASGLEAPQHGNAVPTDAAGLGKTDAAGVADRFLATNAAPDAAEPVKAEPHATEPLEDETDNQENVISQLLGDYDKVRTVSSGSDCVCRCVVRPIRRSDCSHVQNDGPSSGDAYTVETVTKGTDCKQCACMAPSSAVNPCEAEYRFRKLQEASKDDIKLATIMDLLEGSMYGLDLLKLQSVTTKLLTRIDHMEKAFARNLTERDKAKGHVKERPRDSDKKTQQQQKKKKAGDLERAGQKSGAPAFAGKQKNHDGHAKKNQQQDGVEQQQQQQQQLNRNKTATQKPVKEKSGVVVRAVTFYKAEEQSDEEEARGKNISLPVATTGDLLISDSPTAALPTHNPHASPPRRPAAPTAATRSAPTTARPAATSVGPRQTATPGPGTPRASGAEIQLDPPIQASPTAAPAKEPRSRLSWTESPADQPKITKKPAVCKDTVASISEPVLHNLYGLSDGAWMRDAHGHGKVIYVTNGNHGSSLLEFRDMDTFKSGQASNSYKLPYRYTGTGHVVYNGAFYYNRAFSRDVIRYDLRHRYVAAWTTLHDALLEEQAHGTQTEVEFAVDESGLWLLYPAVDAEGFHQEVILLTHLQPRDLQPIRSFRTGLRRGRYGNAFLVCGVLYGVDSVERHNANVTYAFDTHTLTHTVPSLALTNAHGHAAQLAYCPLDKKLYAWDNGRQLTYDIIFAY